MYVRVCEKSKVKEDDRVGLNLQELKCQNCGGKLDIFLAIGRATCKYCGANYLVSGNIDNNSPKVYDSPTGVDIVRCDEDKPITLFDFQNWILEDRPYYSIGPDDCGASGENKFYFKKNRPSFEEVSLQLELLSGVSFVLKKSYVVKMVPLANYRIRNISADPKSIKEVEKESKWDYLNRRVYGKDALQRISERSEYIRKNVENENLAYGRLDLKVQEEFVKKEYGTVCYFPYYDKSQYKAFRSVFKTEDEGKLCIKGSCDVYSYNLVFPIITPDYFERHFLQTIHKYESIKDYPAVEQIAGIISNFIARSSISKFGNIIFRYNCVEKNRIEWSCESSPGEVNYIRFHDFGMDDIEDQLTKKALFLALFQKLVEKTKKDGKYMLDLDDNCFLWDNYYGYIGSYSSGCFSTYFPGVKIKYMEVKEKKYNSW